MDRKFKQGQKLKWMRGPADFDGCYVNYIVGKAGVTDIEVVMENGQMSSVPWALITFKGRPDGLINVKVNLSLMEEVGLII